MHCTRTRAHAHTDWSRGIPFVINASIGGAGSKSFDTPVAVVCIQYRSEKVKLTVRVVYPPLLVPGFRSSRIILKKHKNKKRVIINNQFFSFRAFPSSKFKVKKPLVIWWMIDFPFFSVSSALESNFRSEEGNFSFYLAAGGRKKLLFRAVRTKLFFPPRRHRTKRRAIIFGRACIKSETRKYHASPRKVR